jgi:hypothetical protein
LKNPPPAMRALSSAVTSTCSGREQEDLVGDALDAAAQAEDQAGREVDQPLGVDVVHLGEVHDHRRAVAEVLADGARLVVGARVQAW